MPKKKARPQGADGKAVPSIKRLVTATDADTFSRNHGLFWKRIGTEEDFPRLTPADLLAVAAWWHRVPGLAGYALACPSPVKRFGDVKAFAMRAAHLLSLAAEARGLDGEPILGAAEVLAAADFGHGRRWSRAALTGKPVPEIANVSPQNAEGFRAPVEADRETFAVGLRTVQRLQRVLTVKAGQPAVLHPDEIAILEALRSANTTVLQVDLATKVDLDRKTVGDRLKSLRNAGLVSRPKGERSGDAITPKGLEWLKARKKLPPDVSH